LLTGISTVGNWGLHLAKNMSKVNKIIILFILQPYGVCIAFEIAFIMLDGISVLPILGKLPVVIEICLWINSVTKKTAITAIIPTISSVCA
jgi:hypothetical protein